MLFDLLESGKDGRGDGLLAGVGKSILLLDVHIHEHRAVVQVLLFARHRCLLLHGFDCAAVIESVGLQDVGVRLA